jgi:hypothetical protein
MSERDLEAPEADAIEQGAEVVPDDSLIDDSLVESAPGEPDPADAEVPLEVDPADRVEQQRSVGGADDEDYR